MTGRCLVAVLAAVAILAPTACAAEQVDDEGRSRSAWEPGELAIDVTRLGHRLPRVCEPKRLTRRMIGLMDALNNGQVGRVATHFAHAEFPRYAVEGRYAPTPDFASRDQLIEYLRARHRLREVLEPRALRVNFVERRSEVDGMRIEPQYIAAIEFAFTRTAEDIWPALLRYHGKALFACRSGKIYRWTAGPAERPAAQICPASRLGRQRTVIVCG